MDLKNIKRTDNKEIFKRVSSAGRPTQDENGEKRSKKILSTFTETELEEILEFMGKIGKDNKSSFIRETILNYIRS